MAWLLYNHYQDKEEEFEVTKVLCRFINPEAAKLAFDKNEIVTKVDESWLANELTENSSDKKVTIDQLKNKLKEANTALNSNEEFLDVDTIENVDNEEED